MQDVLSKQSVGLRLLIVVHNRKSCNILHTCSIEARPVGTNCEHMTGTIQFRSEVVQLEDGHDPTMNDVDAAWEVRDQHM